MLNFKAVANGAVHNIESEAGRISAESARRLTELQSQEAANRNILRLVHEMEAKHKRIVADLRHESCIVEGELRAESIRAEKFKKKGLKDFAGEVKANEERGGNTLPQEPLRP